ncbi:MAG: single-stranded DNA-binding protein, partial [Chloroflexales bacterium]
MAVTNETWVRVVTEPGALEVQDGDTVLIIGRLGQNVYVKQGIESKLTEVVASERLAVIAPETTHYNEVIWNGRLAADPDCKYTATGVAMTKLRAIAGDRYTDKSGTEHDTTVGVNMTVWRGLGELVNKAFSKGAVITCTGRVASRTYT